MACVEMEMESAGVIEMDGRAGERSGEGVDSIVRDMTEVSPDGLIAEFEAELSGEGVACIFDWFQDGCSFLILGSME